MLIYIQSPNVSPKGHAAHQEAKKIRIHWLAYSTLQRIAFSNRITKLKP